MAQGLALSGGVGQHISHPEREKALARQLLTYKGVAGQRMRSPHWVKAQVGD